MPYDKLEFVEFLEPTGDTSRRALFRMWDGDDWLLSVSIALTRTVTKMHQLSERSMEDHLPTYARRVIEGRVAREPGWVAANLGRDDVVLNVDSAEFDADEFARADEGS